MANVNNDRLFLTKYDSFIYAIRKIIYYSNVIDDPQIGNKKINTKHDKRRFVEYFGWESTEPYYNKNDSCLAFSNDSSLKDEFAYIYTYSSMSVGEIGDSIQLFSNLSSARFKESEPISGTRNLKNFNRRIDKNSELANSASILVSGINPRKYKKNISLTKDLSDEDEIQFFDALDFAIKKNNFTSFASTYKKMLSCRDNINSNGCDIDIDHQLFHPILDELHIWEVVSALSENRYIDMKYCSQYSENFEDVNNLIPLKIIYDNLYGRSYLFTYNEKLDSIANFRFDRIYSISMGKNRFDTDLAKQQKEQLENILKTAWLVSMNEETEHVVIKFRNTTALRERVKNEGRHGSITDISEDFFTYEIDVNDSYEMINWILNFSDDCKVEQPKHLVEKIVEYLEDMAK